MSWVGSREHSAQNVRRDLDRRPQSTSHAFEVDRGVKARHPTPQTSNRVRQRENFNRSPFCSVRYSTLEVQKYISIQVQSSIFKHRCTCASYFTKTRFSCPVSFVLAPTYTLVLWPGIAYGSTLNMATKIALIDRPDHRSLRLATARHEATVKQSNILLPC